MITRRTLEGAWKCSLRLFLRLEWRWELIFVISAVFVDGGVGGRYRRCRRIVETRLQRPLDCPQIWELCAEAAILPWLA